MLENAPDTGQDGSSLRVTAHQFAPDPLESDPGLLEQTPQMLSTDLFDQSFLADQKISKFGQRPASIG
jgi:hypothetical protein